MNTFLEKNWFKIGILVILGSVVLILWQTTKISRKAASEPPHSTDEYLVENIPTNEPISTSTTTAPVLTKQIDQAQKTETSKTVPERITAQMSAFADYLEYSLVRAQVDCNVFATYNNVASTQQMDTKTFHQAFPESKVYYENKCRDAYLDVITKQNILIAEPELQNLRLLLTGYTEEIKTFSQYALSGGSQGSYIDQADKKMDGLRTLSREEVLRLNSKYPSN